MESWPLRLGTLVSVFHAWSDEDAVRGGLGTLGSFSNKTDGRPICASESDSSACEEGIYMLWRSFISSPILESCSDTGCDAPDGHITMLGSFCPWDAVARTSGSLGCSFVGVAGMFSQCQWHRNVSQQSLLALVEKLALQRGLKYECTLFQRSNRRSTDNGRMK